MHLAPFILFTTPYSCLLTLSPPCNYYYEQLHVILQFNNITSMIRNPYSYLTPSPPFPSTALHCLLVLLVYSYSPDLLSSFISSFFLLIRPFQPSSHPPLPLLLLALITIYLLLSSNHTTQENRFPRAGERLVLTV